MPTTCEQSTYLTKSVQHVDADGACLHSGYQRHTAKPNDAARPSVGSAVQVHTKVRRPLHLRIKSNVQRCMLAKNNVVSWAVGGRTATRQLSKLTAVALAKIDPASHVVMRQYLTVVVLTLAIPSSNEQQGNCWAF